MKKITTHLFSLEVLDSFEELVTSQISTTVEDKIAEKVVQSPWISVRTYKIEDLNSEVYTGNTLYEKFEDWCLSLGYQSVKIEGVETTFKGLKTFTLQAFTDAVWQDTHFKIRYFYAGIFLDDTYFLEFRTLHEKLPSDELDVWVLPAFESLEIIGDTTLRDQAWQQRQLDLEEAEKTYEDLKKSNEEAAEEEKKKDFLSVQIPEDGKEFIAIGDFNFEFIPEKIEVSIPDYSGELVVALHAKTEEIDDATKANLLDDYQKDGLVSISIAVKGIHENGNPNGVLYFEDGRAAGPTLSLYATCSGFDYRLDFNGTVQFDSGWILIKGEMTKSYHDKAFPIQIAKKIDTTTLDWKNYHFSSMEESKTANPKDIRFLFLQNPANAELPNALFSYTNLKDLSISLSSQNWQNEKLPLAEIPSEIGKLTQLKKLHINGASLEKLPESMSELKQLEHLSVNNCMLKSVPVGIWQLPKLKYLWLSANELSEIPEEINLPELQSLSIERNQFKTLPEALAKQPKLKKISLEDNPLEHLPSAFNAVETIELSMEDKLRLLDFEYKGADGKGVVTWNDTVFWSQNDSDLIAEIDEVLKENQLDKHAETLRSLVKKGIGFLHAGGEDYAVIGNHRFGGMPDLTKEMDYPEFFDGDDKKNYKYEFIGQINCEEIAHLQEYLPQKGMLYFFFESIHMIYGGPNNPCKVIYIEDASKLVSGQRFKFTETDYFEMFGEAYAAFKVNATKINSAPSFYSNYVNEHLFIDREALKQDEEFLEEAYEVFEEPIKFKNPFEYAVNAYGFSQHEHPELQASLKQKGNPEDWIILLTVTSSGDMQWGDAGDLFFVIHKSDLAKRDFSNVFVTMESS